VADVAHFHRSNAAKANFGVTERVQKLGACLMNNGKNSVVANMAAIIKIGYANRNNAGKCKSRGKFN